MREVSSLKNVKPTYALAMSVLWLVAVCLSGCGENSKEGDAMPADTTVTQKAPEPIIENTACNLSSFADTVLVVLKQDDYKIQSNAVKPEVLSFYSGIYDEPSIVIPSGSFNFVKLKQSASIEQGGETYFPRLFLYEICYRSPAGAEEGGAKIEKLLNSQDGLNEKQYGFLIIKNDRVLYLHTDARIFADQLQAYKPIVYKLAGR